MVRKLRGDDGSNQELWGEITPVKQYLMGDRPYFTLFGPKSSNTHAAQNPLTPQKPRPVRAIRVTGGGLEPSATSSTGVVTAEIAEDDWNEADPPSDKYWLLTTPLKTVMTSCAEWKVQL